MLREAETVVNAPNCAPSSERSSLMMSAFEPLHL